jgi:hypothetical protein
MGGRSNLAVILMLAAGLLLGLAACGGSAASANRPQGGCAQVIHDVPGRVHPETSGLSCAVIKETIAVGPAEPGVFTVEVGPTHLPWKCRLYGPSSRRLLLSCTYGERHFSVVRRASD